jgi:hypothetical protein
MNGITGFDPAELELRYPVWTLLDTSLPSVHFPGGIQQVDVPGIGRALMIFRDSDFAAQFASHLGRESVRPLALQYPQQIIDVAKHYQEKGATHVGVNIAFRTDPDGKPLPHGGRFTFIAKLIALIRTSLQDPPALPN